jgi:hypothetical protein
MSMAVVTAASCNDDHTTSAQLLTAPTGHALLSTSVVAPDAIAPGQEVQLHVIKRYADGTTELIDPALWDSSDSKVIEVSATGVARGVSVGMATVAAASGLFASKSIIVVPPNTFNLSGRVVEDGLGLEGVTMTVEWGIGQGLTTVTDAKGKYTMFGVAGPIVLQASRDGYQPAPQEVTVTALNTIVPDIVIHQVVPPADFDGQWRMAITPAASCSALSPDIGTRTFDVAISQSGAQARVSFRAPDLFARSPALASSVHVTGTTLEITLATAQDGYYRFYSSNLLYDLMETLDGNRFLGIAGTGRITSAGSSAPGVLDGTFDVYANTKNDYWSAQQVQQCKSPAHHIVMTR